MRYTNVGVCSGIAPDTSNTMDGYELLSMFEENEVDAAFFDPQYRGVLDKLSYGNEGKNRGQERAALAQMPNQMIGDWIGDIGNILKPSGHLFLWIDKFILCENQFAPWLWRTKLEVVDLLTWNKDRMGMGYRTRRQSEYLMILQKRPKRAKGVWLDHAIPDVWTEKVDKNHAHSKPVELQTRLVQAVASEGIVIDPCAGGYSTLSACRRIGDSVTFYGTDLVPFDMENLKL